MKLSRKPVELIAASPKATVPVLVLPSGQVIAESLDIMRWALSQADPEGWLEREDGLLIEANDGPFKHHLDRYKYPDRHGSDPLSHRAGGFELLTRLEVICPLLSGPISILELVTKEEWNGEEAQAGRDHRQAA